MNLPFQLPKIPDFRRKTLDNASRVILQQNGKWLDIIACRGKDLVYVGTIQKP